MLLKQVMRWTAVLMVLLALPHARAATVRVAGGQWRLQGQLVASQLVVESGAVLGGTGTVHGAVLVRGTLAPGRVADDTGALGFTGHLMFDGGEFRCDVAAPDSLDRLVVSGTVSGTATVTVTQAAGMYLDPQVIVNGAADSDYGLFALSAEKGWRLGQSGALDLWLGGQPCLSIVGTNGGESPAERKPAWRREHPSDRWRWGWPGPIHCC